MLTGPHFSAERAAANAADDAFAAVASQIAAQRKAQLHLRETFSE
jgi:hypothetical protein